MPPKRGAVGGQFGDAAGVEAGEQAAVFVHDAAGVGHHQQFFGLHFFGQFAGHQIGVDVEGRAVFVFADGGDDGDASVGDDVAHECGVDGGDGADLADVRAFLIMLILCTLKVGTLCLRLSPSCSSTFTVLPS